jgi:hypothetical protein
MNATKELDTAENIAHEVDEISLVEAELGADAESRLRLEGVRRRLIERGPSVRLSVASELLELSLPTIRAWMEEGLLEEAEGPAPRRVEFGSVLEVRSALRDLRALGQDRNLLAAVSARLEDERDLADPDLRRSLEEMRAGDTINVTPSLRRKRAR